MRLSPLIAAAAIAAFPLGARSQADPSLNLTTTNTQAASEFRAGIHDYQNISFEPAVEHFKAAVAADPTLGIARVMWAASDPELSRAQRDTELNRGVADAAHASVYELILATAYRESAQNHPAAAAALFKAASTMMPNDRLAGFGGALGTFPTAPLQGIRDFAARYPDYAPTYNSLAYGLWNANDRAGALAAARRQVELNPTAPNPHDTYGELLQWSGNFTEANAQYQEAARMTPRFPEAYAGLAEVAALQGNFDQARSYLAQAMTNAWTPGQKLAYMWQTAGTYTLQGASADVISKQFESIAAEAKRLNQNDRAAMAYAQAAASQANAGNVAAAHRYIAMAKAADSTEPWEAHYFSLMAHGLLKHWAPAGDELKTLKAMATPDAGVSPDLVAAADAYLLTQQGKPSDALKILMAADTTNALVINRIAEAHAALGHQAVATTWNNRITGNNAISLSDFTALNSRRRARASSVAVRR